MSERARSSRIRVGCASAALVMLAGALTAHPASAQDCSISRDGWDDIQRFRDCIEERGLEAWSPWVLHRAAYYTTNPTIVRLLLQAGADPNAPDDNGLTPLHRGSENRNPMVVTHLLDAGADLNARDNDGYTALHWAAAQSGNDRVVKVLLDRGADPFAESNDGRTPLHSALRYRADPSVVSRMLDAGADEHLTPLQLSALQGDVMGVDWLLADGADPSEADRYGWGPLHFAVPLGGPELVSALLAAGADPDARTVSGATALHLAASQAPESVIKALLGEGADPNARDEESGKTPLHYAAQYREGALLLPVITALLGAGADPRSPDANMVSPLHSVLLNEVDHGPGGRGTARRSA
ncbi:MAG: ankyrin repeat domain-containing protein [Gemmatimonadetes bacterium]|nr:ankyrin repeat domain-containing protein [Gemmatimonadota bacterium]